MAEQTGLRKIKVGQDFITIVNLIKEMRKTKITNVANNYIDVNNTVTLYFDNRLLVRITHICPICKAIEDVSNKQCKTGPCKLCRRNKCKRERLFQLNNNIDYGVELCACGNVFQKSCKHNHCCPTCQEELDNPLNFKQFKHYKGCVINYCHSVGEKEHLVI